MTGAADAAARAPGPRDLLTTRPGRIALCLFTIELLGAMQVFTTATILPTVAAELDGRSWYGVVVVASTVPVLIMMPLGGRLLARLGPSRMLRICTPVYVLGVVVSAVAPHMALFAAGRAVQGLASGAMATLALGTVGMALPPAWRPRVLALTSAMWVLPALLGPPYAAVVTSAIGWRWSLLILIVPMTVVRLVAARVLTDLPRPSGGPALGVVPAVVVGVSMGVVTVASTGDGWSLLLAAVGAAGALGATWRLLPAGTVRLAAPQTAAVAGVLVLSFAYFGADDVVSVVVHDVLGGTTTAVAVALTAGALAWSAASVVQDRVPGHVLGDRGRVVVAAVVLGGGLVAMAVACGLDGAAAVGLGIVGWVAAGGGMGLGYPVLLNAALAADDGGLGAAEAASAAVLAETVGASLGGVVTATALSASGGTSLVASASFVGLGLVAGLLAVVARRVRRTGGRGVAG